MLMVGDARIADAIIMNSRPNTIIYNFTSLAERYPNRINIIPPNSLGANTEREFDINYMNWIFYNDAQFMGLMQIINNLYNGMDVFLAISQDDWSMMTTESLLKLIQQRYGINGVIINTYEDLDYVEDSTFEPYGLINLDQDLARYQYIIATIGGIRIEE